MRVLLAILTLTLYSAVGYGQQADGATYRQSSLSKEERQKQAQQYRAEHKQASADVAASRKVSAPKPDMSVPQKPTRQGVHPRPAVRAANRADMNTPQPVASRVGVKRTAIRDKDAFDASKPQVPPTRKNVNTNGK